MISTRRTVYEGKGGGRRSSVSTFGFASFLGGGDDIGTDKGQLRKASVAIQGKDLDVSLASSPMATAGLVAVGEEEMEIKRLVDSGKLFPCGFASPPLGLAFYQPLDNSTNNGCCPLRVKKVVPGGAAQQRGVQRGDILIGIQGRPLLQPGLAEALADAQTYPATLFFHRAAPEVAKPVEEMISLSFPRPPLGIAFYELEEEKEDEAGLRVKKATVGGQAHALGVFKGDFLVGINDHPHLRPDGFATVLSSAGNYPLTCHFKTPGARPVTFQSPPLGLAFYEEMATEGLRVKKAVLGGQAEVDGIAKGDVLVGIKEFPHLLFEEFAAVLSSADYYPLTCLFKGTGARPVTFQAPPLGIAFYHFESSRKRWEEQELKVKKALAGTLAHQLGVCRGDVLVGIRSLPQVKGGPGLVAALRDVHKFPLVLLFKRRRLAVAPTKASTLPTPRLFAELGLATAPPSPPSLSRSPSPVAAASSAGDEAVKALSAAAAAADYASTLAAERLEKLTTALRAEVVALNEARKHAAAEEDRSRRQRGAEIAKLDQQTAAVKRVADEAQGAQQRASQQTSLLENRIKELEEQLAGQASQHLQKVGLAADLAERRILAAAEHRLKSASAALERELNEAAGLRHREAVALRALQDVREREEEERRRRVAAEENAARLELLATGELVARVFPMNDLGMSLSAMLPKKWPLQVRSVEPGGVAEQLGVQRGDIVVGIQGRPLLQLGLLDALADADTYPATLLFRRDEAAARRLALLLHLERRVERRKQEEEAVEREKLWRAEEVLRLEQRALEVARARNEIVMRSRSRRRVERADMWKEDPRNIELRSDAAVRWRRQGELRKMAAEDGLVMAKEETRRLGEVCLMEAEDALSFKAREARKTRWRLRGERELQRRIRLWEEEGEGEGRWRRSRSATGLGLEGTAYALAASPALSSLAERLRSRGLVSEARACLRRARDIVLLALPNPAVDLEQKKKAKREIEDPIMRCLFDCPPFGFDFCETGAAVVVTRVQRGSQAARWNLPVGSVIVGVSGEGHDDGVMEEVRSLQHFASLIMSSAFPLVLVFRRPDLCAEEGKGEDEDEESENLVMFDDDDEEEEERQQQPESHEMDLDSVRAALDAWTTLVRREQQQQKQQAREESKTSPLLGSPGIATRPSLGPPPLDASAPAPTSPRVLKAREAAELRLGVRGARVPPALSLQLALEGWAEICQERGQWAARADALERLLDLVSSLEKDEEDEDVEEEERMRKREDAPRVTPSRPVEPLSTAASLSPKRRKKKDREDGNSQRMIVS